MLNFQKNLSGVAATGGHHIEGGATVGGSGTEASGKFFPHNTGCTYRGETKVTCPATAIHRWKDDLALLQSMHLKSLPHFSVAWTRNFPNGGPDWHEEGFA